MQTSDVNSLRHEGTGRTRVSLSTSYIGKDPIICLSNEAGHIGAVAVADYSEKEKRASVSVITRPGHREDSVATEAARKLCKIVKRPVCVIVGIHLDNITDKEIAQILENCAKLVSALSERLSVCGD